MKLSSASSLFISVAISSYNVDRFRQISCPSVSMKSFQNLVKKSVVKKTNEMTVNEILDIHLHYTVNTWMYGGERPRCASSDSTIYPWSDSQEKRTVKRLNKWNIRGKKKEGYQFFI